MCGEINRSDEMKNKARMNNKMAHNFTAKTDFMLSG
jgi:hypothetical protein